MEKRRWGDRIDAVRIKDIDAFHNYTAYLMPKRTESEVFMKTEVDITELLKFIEKRNEGESEYKVTLFHCICAAVTRIIKMRPQLNTFISGKKYWQRREISLSFVAKKRFTDHSEEALMVLKPTDDYTLNDFTRKIVGEVHEARYGKENYGADDVLKVLQKLPGFIMNIVMGILNFMDQHGLMPKSLIDVDPNYTSVLLSNLGSIKCDAVYHHLNNFGSNSIMITIGVMKKALKIMPDGTTQVRDVVEIGATLDERIADGFYFARSLKIVEYLMSHPELLDVPLKEEIPYENR